MILPPLDFPDLATVSNWLLINFCFPGQLENHPKTRIPGPRKSGDQLDKSNMLGDRKEEMEGLMAMQDLVAIDRVSFVLEKYFFRRGKTV